MHTNDPTQPPKRGVNLRTILDVIVTGAVVVAAGFVIWTNVAARQAPASRVIPPPKAPIQVKDQLYVGDLSAPTALIEFSDFQCPYCSQFSRETIPALRQEVASGRLLFVFWNFPLTEAHPLAAQAAEIVRCGALVGKGWDLHDRFFEKLTQKDTDRNLLLNLSTPVVASNEAFDVCVEQRRMQSKVVSDLDRAKAWGVRGTPTFMVGANSNGMVRVAAVLQGAQTIETLKEGLERVAAR